MKNQISIIIALTWAATAFVVDGMANFLICMVISNMWIIHSLKGKK